jgi:hypothetical protein
MSPWLKRRMLGLWVAFLLASFVGVTIAAAAPRIVQP